MLCTVLLEVLQCQLRHLCSSLLILRVDFIVDFFSTSWSSEFCASYIQPDYCNRRSIHDADKTVVMVPRSARTASSNSDTVGAVARESCTADTALPDFRGYSG